MKQIWFLTITLVMTTAITSTIPENNNQIQRGREDTSITYGPQILIDRKEIRDLKFNHIEVNKTFLDTCIAWYRKLDCDNPIHIEEYLLFSDPFSDSIWLGHYLMDPEFYPADSMTIEKKGYRDHGISNDRCAKEFVKSGDTCISFSITAECQDKCWQVRNNGLCYLSSRLYFHKNDTIKYGMEVNKINHSTSGWEYRPDIISVIRNDTLISLYGIQQSFADGGKMHLYIVRKSLDELFAAFEGAEK